MNRLESTITISIAVNSVEGYDAAFSRTVHFEGNEPSQVDLARILGTVMKAMAAFCVPSTVDEVQFAFRDEISEEDCAGEFANE